MATDPLIGRTLGPYRIERRLGGGGMADVYQATHQELGQTRAIKVMSHALAMRDSFVRLFRREARLAAGLDHPNIVRIFDISQQDGLHYLVMPLLEGQSLHTLIRNASPVPLARIVHLVGQLAQALDYAHQHGIAHRDVKPANVFVSPTGVLTLVDFGIARAAEATHLTVTHGIGTPGYMAPELFEERLVAPGADDHTVGVGADRYSLGIVAFELVTGRVPFIGRTANSVAYAHVNLQPAAPSWLRTDLPSAVDAVILRQLAKTPGQRHRTAAAFAEALADAISQDAGPLQLPPYSQSALASSDTVPPTPVPATFHGAITAKEPGPAASAVSSAPVFSQRAVSRWRWAVPLAGLLLLAGVIFTARTPDLSPFSPAANGTRVAESRLASGSSESRLLPTATPPASAEVPSQLTPAPVTAIATIGPTSAPPVSAPSALAAPPARPAVLAEHEVDQIIAQAVALIDDERHPNADLALEKLDRLSRELDSHSAKRPVVEQLTVRALIEEGRRRTDAAFVLKRQNEGRDSVQLLGDAQVRLDRAARIRPDDAALRDRMIEARAKLDLTRWWIDFDVAYKASQHDAQIEALTRIVTTRPDYRTAEGAAMEKLYAAWIAKAEESWAAKLVEEARKALDEALKVDPNHPRARELRLAWFPPPRTAPARAAARPGGGWTAPSLNAGSERAAPPSAPPPAGPEPSAPPQERQYVEIWIVNEQPGSVDHNQSSNSD